MILQSLKDFTLAGGDWVIYLLLLGSVLAVAVIIERWIVIRRETLALDQLRRALPPRIQAKEWEAAVKEAGRAPGVAARILQAGFSQARAGAAAMEEHLAAAGILERGVVEKRLLILGTLGNNAPFVGLFGTVLGVIKAFHDLSASEGGAEVVMRGLSEALVATAVGLFVAIPSVIAYNYYQNRVKELMGGVEALGRLLLARVKSQQA